MKPNITGGPLGCRLVLSCRQAGSLKQAGRQAGRLVLKCRLVSRAGWVSCLVDKDENKIKCAEGTIPYLKMRIFVRHY